MIIYWGRGMVKIKTKGARKESKENKEIINDYESVGDYMVCGLKRVTSNTIYLAPINQEIQIH
jgi:hypothetical protein